MRRNVLPNLSNLLHRATEQLRSAGIENAATEARILCAAILQLDRISLLTQAERPINDTETEQLTLAFNRRAQHEPLARIIGQREFWSLNFGLNAATLVPRPDSEALIETALSLFPQHNAPLRILDLGTGSGCLLLALLHEYPNASGIGVDKAAEAITQAAANATTLGVQARADFIGADWNQADFLQKISSFQPTWNEGDKFDLIISNPPYIASPVIATLTPEVKNYDPIAALDGGADGLAAYRQLADVLPALSHRKTLTLLEIGYDQAASVPALFAEKGHTIAGLRHDLAGNPRCVIIQPCGDHDE
jgi:release factor glutamine methyltransferase